jgi:hypothetical protein
MQTDNPATKYRSGLPTIRGLYDPRMEHDSCGVGMVCQIKGVKSHRIIHDGLQIRGSASRTILIDSFRSILTLLLEWIYKS